MTQYYLMRHAEADYSSPMEKGTKGWGMDLAPLSERGRDQAQAIATEVAGIDPEVVVVSPTTRSMESAMHLLRRFEKVPFQVEFDLHEWVPSWNFSWSCLEDVLRIQKLFESQGGEYVDGRREEWESLSCIRHRVGKVLERYSSYNRVLVICHGMVMRALTGEVKIANTQILRYIPPLRGEHPSNGTNVSAAHS